MSQAQQNTTTKKKKVIAEPPHKSFPTHLFHPLALSHAERGKNTTLLPLFRKPVKSSLPDALKVTSVAVSFGYC